ncbi:hypothetical protein LINPERHAP1_LOCUS37426 [Linum perenne]
MASGSSGRPSSGSKGFEFDSDDILCSYDDFSNQDTPNGNHSDPVPAPNSSKQGFDKSRMSRSSVYQAASYGQPDDSFHQDVVSAVERSMKRHSENQMRFLEGISSRLSQLELYCYNLDKSIGEMRSDLTRDHSETDMKLKGVEKHLHEVHRSVQILRDKQELAETQKELAKLHLVHKDSTSSTHSQSNDEKSASPAFDPKKNDNASEGHNQQLALALPQQVPPQQQPISAPVQSHVPQQNLAQGQPQTYYQLAVAPPQSQPPHTQYMTPDSQYRSNQMQGGMQAQPVPAQVSQAPPPPGQQYPQYQQQWPQQVQVQQSQQPTQVRQQSNTVYSPYPPPNQPTVGAPPPQETLSSSMPIPTSYSTAPQPLSSRVDTIQYGYGTGRPAPQQMKVPFGTQPGDAFTTAGPHGATYLVYDTDGGRPHHQTQPPPHYSQGGYPPSNHSLQTPQPGAPPPNMMPRNPPQPQFVRNHPYNELIEKLVSMGFRGDHVMSVIQRLEETGQPVDFNAVIDRLNVHPSGASQRGWSG